MEILEYLDPDETSPFARWFDTLDVQAARRVVVALARIELGNLSNTKSVGAGVLESKIDAGPGYRIYFGRDGDTLVILLAGGTKRRPQKDIVAACDRRALYKLRKKARSHGTHP